MEKELLATSQNINEDVSLLIEFLYVEASYLRKMKDDNI